MQWAYWPDIRGDSPQVKILLQGESGRIDDYEFMLSRINGPNQYSPRHRHVFDQFRYAVKGEVPYDPTHTIPEGGLAYFPEGTPYGPFHLPENMILLSLQFGGPSGLGHLHTEDLHRAHNELTREGAFEKG